MLSDSIGCSDAAAAAAATELNHSSPPSSESEEAKERKKHAQVSIQEMGNKMNGNVRNSANKSFYYRKHKKRRVIRKLATEIKVSG